MARTLTGGERTVLAGQKAAHFLRVQVRNAAAALVDLRSVGGRDYQLSATVISNVDTPADTATVTIRAGVGTTSVAPLMTSASANSGGRLLDAGRGIVIDVATLAVGSSPGVSDWKTVFDGTIDTVSQGDGERITLSCRNRMLPLLDASSEDASTVPAQPAQDMLAALVNLGLGVGGPTIVTPVSPSWSPAKIEIARGGSTWAAMAQVADQIGWTLRYRWSGNTPELRFYAPNRSLASADWTLAASEVAAVRDAALDLAPVRNAIRVGYRTSPSAALQVASATDSASALAYGLRRLIVDEASTSQIDTLAEAQTMADAILSDLVTPPYSHVIEHRHAFWAVEVGDIIDVAANGVTHDATQRLAVVGTELAMGAGGGSMTLRLRGKPASRTSSWLTLGGGTPLPPGVVCRVTASTATSITVTVTNEPAGGVVRYLGGTATRTAGPLANVDSAEGTTWTFTRPAFQAGDLEALFSGTVNGLTDTDSVTIGEQGRDTVALLTRLRILSQGPTTVTVRVSASATFGGGGAGTSTFAQITGCTVSGQVEGNTAAITIGTSDGDYSPTSKYADYVVTRPAPGAVPGRVTMRVDASGFSGDSDSVDIPAQDASVPGRVSIIQADQSGADFFVRFRAFEADGTQVTATGRMTATLFITPVGGAPTTTTTTVTYDGVNTWFSIGITRATGELYTLRLSLSASGATAQTETTSPLPTYVVGASAGTPRIATCSVSVPATAGDVELLFTTGDAPSGSQVNAYLTYNANRTNPIVGIGRNHLNITTGEPIAFGRATSSSPYLTPYRVLGTVELVDSTGKVLDARALPTNTTSEYFGT
jgi:hypothetical protein